ncbi:MAG: hypothetical protein CSA62_02880 [Planctomycetota bacterium]|nr:MAG: hypothetical protein CSA62_02880 [Planctomycetota bacterium]
MLVAFAFIGGFGTSEIIIVLVLGLVLFGGRLPEVGKSVAKGILEFKKGLRDLKDEAGLKEIEDLRHEVTDLARAPDYAYHRGSIQDEDNAAWEAEIEEESLAEAEAALGEVSRESEDPELQSGTDPEPTIDGPAALVEAEEPVEPTEQTGPTEPEDQPDAEPPRFDYLR